MQQAGRLVMQIVGLWSCRLQSGHFVQIIQFVNQQSIVRLITFHPASFDSLLFNMAF